MYLPGGFLTSTRMALAQLSGTAVPRREVREDPLGDSIQWYHIPFDRNSALAPVASIVQGRAGLVGNPRAATMKVK